MRVTIRDVDAKVLASRTFCAYLRKVGTMKATKIGLTAMQSMPPMSIRQTHSFLSVAHTLTETKNVKEYASETPPRDEKCKLKYHDI